MAKYFLLCLIIIIQCSSNGTDTHYFMTYNSDSRTFKDEISETELRGINYYAVIYKSGQVQEFTYYKMGKPNTFHQLVYDKTIQQRNLDATHKLLSVEYFSPEGYVNKVVQYSPQQNIVREEFYSKWQVQTALVRAIDYIEGQKKVYYYKYLQYMDKLHHVIDKLEVFESNQLVERQIFHYNNEAHKTKVAYYRGNQTNHPYKTLFYDKDGDLEEEREYNGTGKLIHQRLFPKNRTVNSEPSTSQ